MIQKRTLFLKKLPKRQQQSGKTINIPNVINIENKAHIYKQKLILKELNQLTSLVKAINERMIHLEHKVDNNKKKKR
jgi:hypothetical protein